MRCICRLNFIFHGCWFPWFQILVICPIDLFVSFVLKWRELFFRSYFLIIPFIYSTKFDWLISANCHLFNEIIFCCCLWFTVRQRSDGKKHLNRPKTTQLLIAKVCTTIIFQRMNFNYFIDFFTNKNFNLTKSKLNKLSSSAEKQKEQHKVKTKEKNHHFNWFERIFGIENVFYQLITK